jgi:hypothetical protein
MAMKLSIGLNKCSNAEYHADSEYLSSSNFKTLLTDPEKFYKEKILGEKEAKQSNSFDEGSLTHSIMLEPHLVSSEFSFFPGKRKQGEAFDIFKAANPGKVIISESQKIRVGLWVEAIKKNKIAMGLLKGGEAEQTICADMNGIPVKIRCDYIIPEQGIIADIKTTAYPIDIDTFRLTVKEWSYDLSASLYAHIAELHYGRKFNFYFIVVGKNELVCEVYKASKKTLETGMLDIAKAASIYKKCKASGVWKLDQPLQISKEEEVEILEI